MRQLHHVATISDLQKALHDAWSRWAQRVLLPMFGRDNVAVEAGLTQAHENHLPNQGRFWLTHPRDEAVA